MIDWVGIKSVCVTGEIFDFFVRLYLNIIQIRDGKRKCGKLNKYNYYYYYLMMTVTFWWVY